MLMFVLLSNNYLFEFFYDFVIFFALMEDFVFAFGALTDSWMRICIILCVTRMIWMIWWWIYMPWGIAEYAEFFVFLMELPIDKKWELALGARVGSFWVKLEIVIWEVMNHFTYKLCEKIFVEVFWGLEMQDQVQPLCRVASCFDIFIKPIIFQLVLHNFPIKHLNLLLNLHVDLHWGQFEFSILITFKLEFNH